MTLLRVSSFSSNAVDFGNKFQLLPLWESWSWQKLKRRKIFEKYYFRKSFSMNQKCFKEMSWIHCKLCSMAIKIRLYSTFNVSTNAVSIFIRYYERYNLYNYMKCINVSCYEAKSNGYNLYLIKIITNTSFLTQTHYFTLLCAI